MTTKAEKDERAANAREQLLKLLPKGSTVYCIIKGVSRSGMSRNIDFYAGYIEGGKVRMQWLTGYMSALGVVKQSESDWRASRGAKVHGCGMDMGFHCVDYLATTLYGRDERGLGAGLKHEWL